MATTPPIAGEAQPTAALPARFGEERLLQMYYEMLLSRKLDERLWIMIHNVQVAPHFANVVEADGAAWWRIGRHSSPNTSEKAAS